MPAESALRRIVVALIHPSNYDHSAKGGCFVRTYARGVIPCNTLRALHSLTAEALAAEPLARVPSEVHVFEDSVRGQQKAFRRLLARFPRRGELLVVGLVGVQSNQFPRACDLIEAAKERGAAVVIGGPHVTAAINAAYHGISTIDPLRPGVPSPHCMPVEIQRLIDDPRAIVFHGDADSDGAWGRLLVEIVEGRRSGYVEGGLAKTLGAPGLPYSRRQLRAFAAPVAAVDTERGCPFKCKFCAAIQAHGRTVRCRRPEAVVEWVRRQCEEARMPITVLFASDNLARNPHWRELLAGLADLRAEGREFTIWAEADVLCDTGPNRGFLEAYAKAGGQGLFLGIESMNPANVAAAGKTQNSVDALPAFFERCRAHGIAPEGGYIVGFEHDTPESVAREVQMLVDAGLSRAWFFMKTLLPGSQDWVEWTMAGKPASTDLNDYDSTTASYQHERMTAAEWTKAYMDAVRTFYSPENMAKTLRRFASKAQRWRLVAGLMWCRWAYLVEGCHPMIAGWYRHRPLSERRPGTAPVGLLRHAANEAWRHMRYAGLFLREFYIFQQVVLDAECMVNHAEARERLAQGLSGMGDWLDRTFRAPMCRAWLNDFWVRYGSQKWRLLSPLKANWHLKMLPHALSEVAYTLRFGTLLLHGLNKYA